MKKAFTLAEVLITLVVIGIVAAISLQVIIVGHLKTETTARVKKVLSTINQALQLSTIQNGELDAWEDYKTLGYYKYMETYWYPYFRNIKICKKYSDCGYQSNKPYKNPNGTSHGHTLVYNNRRVPFLTDDNIAYSFDPVAMQFAVDINGAKGPNRIGRDMFYFEFDAEGKSFRTYGYNATPEELKLYCSRTNATCCATKMIKDGWEIKPGYPW
ncbi:MAG: type II secretion system protein [Candidatus Gastranaerophilales bacterium]|nr:type II secretion system protein [Candidatus Gastranaerophilales bacterium]